MDLFDLTQSFIERCERAAPVEELATSFQSAIELMGFRYFACCSHVNPGNPPRRAVVLHNYPNEWVRYFAEQDLHARDPVFAHAELNILPFYWDAPAFNAALKSSQRQMLLDAQSFCIAHGYTVPIHLPWITGALRASCSVVPDLEKVGARVHPAVQIMSTYLYASIAYQAGVQGAREAASGGGTFLRARERECLELAARGKSDWEISQLLGISEHTVHKHVEAAKRRLGVSTRVQAIVWAAQRLEISLGDVVRAVPANEDSELARTACRTSEGRRGSN